MAQNIQIAGATFNAVPSIVVPVAGGGSATFVDPSPTTAAAADVASGKLFFDALGVLTQGTASGGGGSGLVYETGEYKPTSNSAQPTINFTGTHTTRPYSIVIEDVTGTNTTSNTVMFWTVISWYDAFGTPATSSNGGFCYGGLRWGYGASNGFAANGGNINSEAALATYMTAAHFIPYCNSSSFVYRTGRTYKWIAVWAP